MKRIADEWADFQRMVLPPGAGEVQRREMRRAFYAGASAMLMVQLAAAPDDVSEEQGAAMMQSWHDELVAFGTEMAAGRA